MRQRQNKVALVIATINGSTSLFSDIFKILTHLNQHKSWARTLIRNNMKQTSAPDTRPAIAFSTATEVKTIMQALRAYRVYEITDEEYKEFIRKLEDEHEKVLDMFKGE